MRRAQIPGSGVRHRRARHRLGLPRARRGCRTAGRGTAATLVVVPVVLGLLLGAERAAAGFSSLTTTPASAFGSAATFSDYPTTVEHDHPLVYYRLDDAPGSVTALDSSGHGTTGVYGSANFASWTGLWPMDEGAGNTANDLAGVSPAHNLTLNATSWTTGRSGSGLAFDGSSSYAATGSAVLTTTGSFTVSAWVLLSDTTTSRTAVSQDGTAESDFELGYNQGLNRWVFRMARTDSAAATIDTITSAAAPTVGVWTQLTATFNSGTKGMDLYVNGVHDSGAIFGGTAWNATGALEVGAGRTTTRTRFWQGSIDNVRVQSSAVSGNTALELTLATTGGPSTYWPLDENTGRTTVDYSGDLNTGTLGSAASWGGAKGGASSIDVPGDATGNGYVAGSSAAVSTASSFTVAAWVYLDHTALATMSRVAVSQSGTVKSGFMLRYDDVGQKWEFDVTRGPLDDNSPVYDASTSAANSAALQTWTHLVGVFDANTQKVTLYVNGTAQASGSHSSLFSATGATQLGRVKEFGAWQVGSPGSEAWGPWAGRIDDVKLFRRALDQAEVTAVYNWAGPGNTLGVPGALQGSQQGQSGSTALAYARNARTSYDPQPIADPTTYSLECWVRTLGVPGGTQGQTIFSFSSAATGNTLLHDRRVYLDTSGHLVVGTGSGGPLATSPAVYTDGAWHHVVATVSPGNGVHLYVDGALVAGAAYLVPVNITGYWRFGGDTHDGAWPADYFWLGELDEVAIYSQELTAAQVAEHYHADH